MSTEPLLPRANSATAGADGLLRHQVLNKLASATWLLLPWVLGAALGLLLPHRGTLPSGFADTASHVLGWTYFTAWSISWYPQLWLNFRRQSVVGMSLDFQLLNLLGFGAYAIYNVALYYNPVIRKQYASLHAGQLPAVHANDVFFALHATFATCATLVQCCLYDRGGARLARATVAGVAATAAAAGAWAAAVILVPAVKPETCQHSCPPESLLTWLSWLYFLGFIKMGVSLVKYIPQVHLNWRRRSTAGFNMWNVVLDFEGGVLSLAQQGLDSSACHDWSWLTGNPIKFLIGSASMFFDVIFIAQRAVYGTGRHAAALAALDRDVEKASYSALEDKRCGQAAAIEGVAEAERRALLE